MTRMRQSWPLIGWFFLLGQYVVTFTRDAPEHPMVSDRVDVDVDLPSIHRPLSLEERAVRLLHPIDLMKFQLN